MKPTEKLNELLPGDALVLNGCTLFVFAVTAAGGCSYIWNNPPTGCNTALVIKFPGQLRIHDWLVLRITA